MGSETGGTARESELFYKEESELLLKGVFLPQQVCSRFVTGEGCVLLLQIQPPRQFLLLCRDYSFGNYLGDIRAKTGLKPSLMTRDCISIALLSQFLPCQHTNGAAGATFCPFASWFLHMGDFWGCPAPFTLPTVKLPDCFCLSSTRESSWCTTSLTAGPLMG